MHAYILQTRVKIQKSVYTFIHLHHSPLFKNKSEKALYHYKL